MGAAKCLFPPATLVCVPVVCKSTALGRGYTSSINLSRGTLCTAVRSHTRVTSVVPAPIAVLRRTIRWAANRFPTKFSCHSQHHPL
ncbi:hypothetical protein BJX65DRAFT_288836 [Aspergillus insuetus]